MKTFFSFTLLLFAVLMGGASAAEQSRGPWSLSVKGGASYQAESGLKDGSGDFAVARSFIEPGVGYAFDRKNRISFSVRAGLSDYSFGDGAELGGDQPWDRIREYGVGATLFFAPADRIQAMVIPNVRWQSETGASLDDGRTESVIAGASYKFSDDFSIGPGIGWSSRLGGGSSVFPILLLDWNLTESLNITTRPDLAVGSGPGLTVSQDLGNGFQLGVTAHYENTRFRLDDTTSTEQGIGQNSGVPVIASVSFQPYPALRVQGFLGVKLGGELRLRDRRGETIETRDHQAAPITGIAVRARF